MDDLVKRLQDYLDCRPRAAGRTFDPTHPECLIAQAKDRIEALERENERLREGLRKIEEAASLGKSGLVQVTIRRARSILGDATP